MFTRDIYCSSYRNLNPIEPSALLAQDWRGFPAATRAHVYLGFTALYWVIQGVLRHKLRHKKFDPFAKRARAAAAGNGDQAGASGRWALIRAKAGDRGRAGKRPGRAA